MAWDPKKYNAFLLDQAPHYEDEFLRDWFPTDDAWIGQVKTVPWKSGTGTEHVRDKLHIGTPDLSQAWTRFDTQTANCTTACSPPEVSVGWGSTRTTFTRERISYTTNVLCLDEIDTRAKAKEQFGAIISGLKDITQMVQSDYMRRNALQMSDKIYICGSALGTVTVTGSTFTGAATTISLSSGDLPTSRLTIQYLQRHFSPLQYAGYFKSKFVPAGMVKVITDITTSEQLIQENPTLVSAFRQTDFMQGGKMFKYGISSGIGNFAIAWDPFPPRYYWDSSNAVLRRVFPYVNASATIGLKPTVATEYELAPYQISYIWHPEAMVRHVPTLESVHPEMPFMTRDQIGKWHFVGGDRDRSFSITNPNSGETAVIDNKRGNQGAWWSDFHNSMEMQYPQWTRSILHLREPGCVTNLAACSTAPAYVRQNYNDLNVVCPVV